MRLPENQSDTYWKSIWKQYRRHPLGIFALWVVILFALVGIYAPFLASSKPLTIKYNGEWFFPLFRYLFYSGFFTKKLDLFFNLLEVTFLLAIIILFSLRKELPNRPKLITYLLAMTVIGQFLAFAYLAYSIPKDPATNPELNQAREHEILKHIQAGQPFFPSWEFDLHYMNSYARLNQVLQYQQRRPST